MISARPKKPIATETKPSPSANSGMLKVMRSAPELTSMPTIPSSSPSPTMASDLTTEPCARITAATRPRTIRLKNSTAVKLSASLNKGPLSTAMTTVATVPARERRQRGDGQRGAGAAVAGHLVAVQAGDHRGGLAGNVDQDGGGRTSVLRAVEDPGQHDEAGGRRHAEGERQQQRHGRHRADARQHADHGADQRADQAVQQVVPAARWRSRSSGCRRVPCPLPGKDRHRQRQRPDEDEHR